MDYVENRELANSPPGRWVKVAGLVLILQRPATGIVFETLEDETGIANLIVLPKDFRLLPSRGPSRPALSALKDVSNGRATWCMCTCIE